MSDDEEKPPFSAAPPWSESTVAIRYCDDVGAEIPIDPEWTMRYAAAPPIVGDLVRIRRLGRVSAETFVVKMRTWGSNPRATVCLTVEPFPTVEGG